MKKTQRRPRPVLPIADMVKAEMWVAEHMSSQMNFDDLPALCKYLSLRVDTKALPLTVESTLKPSQSDEYLGVIELNAMPDTNLDKFPLLHGIVRYLLEYGIGGKVTKKHSCVKTSLKKAASEAYVDYICYAIIMPWREVANDIIRFQEKRYRVDELAYVAECGKKYGEEITRALTSQYFHRMKQVISLVKEPTFVQNMRLFSSKKPNA